MNWTELQVKATYHKAFAAHIEINFLHLDGARNHFFFAPNESMRQWHSLAWTLVAFLCSAFVSPGCLMVLYICEKFHNNILNCYELTEWTRDMVEMATFNVQRAITPKVGKPELRFLCSVCCHIVLYIYKRARDNSPCYIYLKRMNVFSVSHTNLLLSVYIHILKLVRIILVKLFCKTIGYHIKWRVTFPFVFAFSLFHFFFFFFFCFLFWLYRYRILSNVFKWVQTYSRIFFLLTLQSDITKTDIWLHLIFESVDNVEV